MVRFFLKCLLLVGILFFGVLFGMEQANVSMKKMKGYDDPALNSAFTMQDSADGELEASVLGKKVTSHDLEQKKKQLEEMKTYNFFSNMGKKLAEAVTVSFRKLFEVLAGLV